ncbi:MAG: carboxypeptidase regulatory-like domain-containing protein, partial [Opitutaceae bacterium]
MTPLPRLLLLLLTWLAIAPALPAAATPAAVSGRVQNAVTGQYLPNARVTVRGTDRVVFTDDAGIFRLTGIAPGSVTLDVFYTGLDPQELKLDLAPGATVTREVALTNVARYGRDTAAVRLDSFVVATS